MDRYDPLIPPPPAEWLEMDEQERLDLVRAYHDQAGEALPNLTLHAAIHVVVENQCAMSDEIPVQETLERLMREGLDRHDAIHAIGSVLAGYMEALSQGERGPDDGEAAYYEDLKRLSAAGWLETLNEAPAPPASPGGGHKAPGGPPKSHPLYGLMKWLEREPWSSGFNEALQDHVVSASEDAGIEIGELLDTLGDDSADVLWLCAFEDFMTWELDPDGNIVDAYLKRRGWKEKARNKAYMQALRTSVMSLYEVSEVTPGKSFLARDLFRGGEPVPVSERSATVTLKPWDRIAARVVEVGGKAVIGGGLLPFDRDGADAVLDALRKIRADMQEQGEDCSDEDILSLSASEITSFWILDLLERIEDPPFPELRNADGDELGLVSLDYPLLPGVDEAQLGAALDGIEGLYPDEPGVWNWGAADGPKALGTLVLEDGELTLMVDSEDRAERGRALLSEPLRGLVGEPRVEHEEIDMDLAAEGPRATERESLGLSAEQQRDIVQGVMEEHYRGLLDEPVPMLDGMTPREAAGSERGRELLVDWLKLLENASAHVDPDDPMAGYDVSWMWEELGVADLRR